MAMVFCVILWFASIGVSQAQILQKSDDKVDTLSILQRTTLRFNIVDWALTVPNIGAEFDIRRENWNRWSALVNIRWRPDSKSTYVQPWHFNIFEVTLEGRQYWRERECTPTGYLRPHHMWYDKILSCRATLPSHPSWVFYRGGFASYTQYSVLMKNSFGQQGTAAMVGFTWGFVKPLLEFGNGTSLNLEVGASVGGVMAKYKEIGYDEESNCYPVKGEKGWHIKPYPMIKDIHVAVAMRMGNYPLRKKYRWRYDVDMKYRVMKDSILSAKESEADKKYIADSIYRVVSARYKELYDSLARLNTAIMIEKIEAEAPERYPADSIGGAPLSAKDKKQKKQKQPKQPKQSPKKEKEAVEAKEPLKNDDAVKPEEAAPVEEKQEENKEGGDA